MERGKGGGTRKGKVKALKRRERAIKGKGGWSKGETAKYITSWKWNEQKEKGGGTGGVLKGREYNERKERKEGSNIQGRE